MPVGGGIAWFTSVFQIDPVVVNWVNSIVALGGSVSSNTQLAFDDYVKGCKSDGYWNILAAGYILPFASDGFAGFFEPLTTTPYEFLYFDKYISSDYSLATGLTGANGKDCYIWANVDTIADFNDFQFSVYTRVANSPSWVNLTVFAAANQTSDRFLVALPGLDGTTYYDAYRPGNAATHTFDTLGLTSCRSRTGTNQIYSRGLPVGSISPSSGSFPNSKIGLFFNCNGTWSYFRIGRSLSTAQEGLHNNRVQTLQADLGRAV